MNSPYYKRFRVSQEYKGSAHDGLDLVGVDSKEIHSTVNGTVVYAGWENANNTKQGFGQYVKIKKDNSNDYYYFGHLSEIRVKAGEHVKVTQVIGIEGSTGYSTGSHCHYCVRVGGIKGNHKNISEISGIPNSLGTYDDGYRVKEEKRKSIDDIAREVIRGDWGNGQERKDRLTNAGYNYREVQDRVNQLI